MKESTVKNTIIELLKTEITYQEGLQALIKKIDKYMLTRKLETVKIPQSLILKIGKLRIVYHNNEDKFLNFLNFLNTLARKRDGGKYVVSNLKQSLDNISKCINNMDPYKDIFINYIAIHTVMCKLVTDIIIEKNQHFFDQSVNPIIIIQRPPRIKLLIDQLVSNTIEQEFSPSNSVKLDKAVWSFNKCCDKEYSFNDAKNILNENLKSPRLPPRRNKLPSPPLPPRRKKKSPLQVFLGNFFGSISIMGMRKRSLNKHKVSSKKRKSVLRRKIRSNRKVSPKKRKLVPNCKMCPKSKVSSKKRVHSNGKLACNHKTKK